MATPKKVGAPKKTKANIVIGNIEKVDKEMPKYTGKGAKYSFLEQMNIGDCMCFPDGSVNVSDEILKRAIQGAARRIERKVVCAREPEGFCVWRKE